MKDKYTERAIVDMYAGITGVGDRKYIVDRLSGSDIFLAVKAGNDVVLYESPSALLFEIVEDLKAAGTCPLEAGMITEKSIAEWNRKMRDSGTAAGRRKRAAYVALF